MLANTNEKYERGKKKKKTAYTHMNKLYIQLFTQLSNTTFLIACDDNWFTSMSPISTVPFDQHSRIHAV